jgi:hypothetical protein
MQPHDSNHHLWRNGRLWWVAFVAVVDGVRQVRIRQSLKTDDVVVARQRRDAVIEAYARRDGWFVPLRMQVPLTARTIRDAPPPSAESHSAADRL